jgi:predicted kinase
MKRAILLMGLPRSGKSVLAQKLHETLHYPIICPDDFRLALHGEAFIGNAERFVWASAFVAARALLHSHEGVIVDACNRTRARRDEWRRELGDVAVEVLEVDTAASICLQRTSDQNLTKAIERMAAGFEHRQDDESPFMLGPSQSASTTKA